MARKASLLSVTETWDAAITGNTRSADMALRRKLRAILKRDGYKPPIDIRYICRDGGEPIDAAVVYGPPEINDIPTFALYVVEDGELVSVYERQFC